MKNEKRIKTAKELWDQFSKGSHLEDCTYETWAFGADADLLAHLTAAGVKTATSSAYPLYELQNEPLPAAGEYSVIVDSKSYAVCVIQTQKVTVVPFREVTAEHAFREGEGDRTLDYWREAHQKFFSECLKEAGLDFSEDMKVVCEEYAVVYP